MIEKLLTHPVPTYILTGQTHPERPFRCLYINLLNDKYEGSRIDTYIRKAKQLVQSTFKHPKSAEKVCESHEKNHHKSV